MPEGDQKNEIIREFQGVLLDMIDILFPYTEVKNIDDIVTAVPNRAHFFLLENLFKVTRARREFHLKKSIVAEPNVFDTVAQDDSFEMCIRDR